MAELHRAQAQREAAWSTLKAQAGPESPRYQVRMMMPCNGRDTFARFQAALGNGRDWSAFKHEGSAKSKQPRTRILTCFAMLVVAILVGFDPSSDINLLIGALV